MEIYSHETLIRQRSHQIQRAAETAARLDEWLPQDRFNVRLAMSLRRLADRLDGRRASRVFIYPG